MRSKRKILMILAILLFYGGLVQATNTTFSSSGTIVNGNVYDKVYVQNDGTVVNMTGGQISNLSTHNVSTFNMSGGQIIYSWPGILLYELSTMNVSGGTINTFDFVVYGSANFSGGNITANRLKTYPASFVAPASVVNINGGILNFDMFDIHGTLNIYRGLLNVDNSSIGYLSNSLANINIYGSEFNYNPSTQILTGRLLDNNFFTIKGIDTSEYTRFNLLPEPSSILLLGFGLLALRKQK